MSSQNIEIIWEIVLRSDGTLGWVYLIVNEAIGALKTPNSLIDKQTTRLEFVKEKR
jgi:hypothetical protein